MPKMILTFNLPKEKVEAKLATMGSCYYYALSTFSESLRQLIKYGELTKKEYNIVQKVRGNFHSILEDWSIRLEE